MLLFCYEIIKEREKEGRKASASCGGADAEVQYDPSLANARPQDTHGKKKTDPVDPMSRS